MREKISGVSKKKAQLDELLSEIASDDTLVVTRMDRLGRITVQLLQLVEQLRERNIHANGVKISSKLPTKRRLKESTKIAMM